MVKAASRPLLTLAEKIGNLDDEEVKQVNAYMGILKSNKRIAFTEIEQVKRMFSGLKEAYDRL